MERQPEVTIHSQTGQSRDPTLESSSRPSKYVPTGVVTSPSDPMNQALRPNSIYDYVEKVAPTQNGVRHPKDESSSDESTIYYKDSIPKVAYKPLEVDSEFESDLCPPVPQLKKVPLQEKCYEFPNPDNYDDPRKYRSQLSRAKVPELKVKELSASQGDFNELGIPIDRSYEKNLMASKTSLSGPSDVSTMPILYEARDQSEISKILVGGGKFLPTTDGPPRPLSRDQTSSGFGSLPDVSDGPGPTLSRMTTSASKGSLSSRTESESAGESQRKHSPKTTNF